MNMTETLDRTIESFTKKQIAIPDELRIADQNEAVGVEDSTFRILTVKDGDKRVVWNRKSIPEINAAKRLFDELKNEGLVPFKVGIDGEATSEEIELFDASAEEVIFLPMKMVAGG